MKINEDAFNEGFVEGKLCGKVEIKLSIVQNLMKEKKFENCEEAFKLLEISDDMCARLMDYLPVGKGKTPERKSEKQA